MSHTQPSPCREIRDAYETHILPFTQPSGRREGDINRFLELLEQREKYMPRGQQKMVDPEQYAAITQQSQNPPRIQAQPQSQQRLHAQQQPQQQLPPRWTASPGATNITASPAATTITAVPVEASPRRAAQKNPVGQRARPVDPEASAQRAARSASYDEEKQRILDRIRAIEESNGRAASGTPPPEPQPQPQHKAKFPAAAQHAADLHRATKGLGTEEEAVFVVLSRVQSQGEWDAVRRQFKAAYPQFSGGDVVAVLREDMGRQQMDTCRRILSRNGVELEPAAAAPRDGGAAAAVPPLPPAAQQQRREAATTPAELADVLHAAMKGIGTDERAVFDVMERVRTQHEWDDVRARFRATHPRFCDGSVVEALRDELNRKEMEVCRQILARKNIVLEPSVAAAATPSAAPTRTRAQHPAAVLHAAMAGGRTDERAVFGVMERVRTQPEWDDVRRTFLLDFPDVHGGDVERALAADLGGAEVAACRRILARRGIASFDGVETPKRAAAAEPSAGAVAVADDLLRAADVGGAADERAVFAALERVESQAEWDDAKADYERRMRPGVAGGTAVGALRACLGRREMEQCRQILALKGVLLEFPPGGGGHAVEARKNVSPQRRSGSVIPLVTPVFPEHQHHPRCHPVGPPRCQPQPQCQPLQQGPPQPQYQPPVVMNVSRQSIQREEDGAEEVDEMLKVWQRCSLLLSSARHTRTHTTYVTMSPLHPPPYSVRWSALRKRRRTPSVPSPSRY